MRKTIYTDKKGYRWTAENLEDLIQSYASFKQFYETFLHYSHRF